MVIGRIKILLIAFLILSICLLFFNKNNEKFIDSPNFPPSLLYTSEGTTTGVIGFFNTRPNSSNDPRMSFDDDLDNLLILCEEDLNDNSIISTISSIKSACFTNNVLTKNLIFYFKGDVDFFAYSVTQISDLTSDSYNGRKRLDGLGDRKFYRLSITKVGPIVNGDIKGGNINIIGGGEDLQISYLYTNNCIVTGFVDESECVPTGPITCELTDTSKSGRIATQKRILIPAKGGTCPATLSGSLLVNNNVQCSLPVCVLKDCVPGPWTASGTCIPSGSATCEPTETSKSGLQTQIRTVAPAVNGGTCSTEDSATIQTAPCSLARCPVNCVASAWANSGTCVATGPATCESTASSQSGSQAQTRTIAPAQFGGTCTESVTTRQIPCSLPGCPTNCVPSAWTNSGTCAANAGGQTCETSATSLSGKQLQTRVITPATNGGSCPDTSTSKTIDCALSRCPINCNPTAWTNSGTCMPNGESNCETSLTSKSGKQTQLREITPSQFGGTCADSATTQTIDCALSTRCPVPCELSAWANDGTCQNTSNVECEPTMNSMSGLQTQFQTITKPAEFGGACPIVSPNTSNTQTMPCRLSNLPRCTNPFANKTLLNLMTISYKDFPIFGNIPKNNVRFTSCNVGDNIATVFETMENFNEGTNTICV